MTKIIATASAGLPVLEDDGNNFVGSTGYIDRIESRHLNGEPAARGVVKDGRPFLVITGSIELTFDNGTASCKRKFMQTIFQRHAANPWLWVGSGHSELINTSGGATIEQLRMIAELLDKKIFFASDAAVVENLRLISALRYQIAKEPGDAMIVSATIRLAPLPLPHLCSS